MPNAQERGWGNPGPPGSAQEATYKRQFITALKVAGVTLHVRKEVAPLFKGLIDELSRLGYRLNGRADDWGYANRDVRGRPGVKSNHAWGLAIDLNSATNPMTNDGRNHTDLPSNVSALARKWGLRWGGDYTGSRKDPMHFEYMGTPREAQQQVARMKSVPRKKRLDTNPYRVPVVTESNQAQRHASGEGVAWIQHQLGIKTNHEFDETTVRAVMAFQKKHGLKVDGKVGSSDVKVLKTL